MVKFSLYLTKTGIAQQIANLLNWGGQFYYHILPYHILNNNVKYIIELNQNKVIGVIGLQARNNYVTELKHLAVHPTYRKMGLGKKLLEIGIKAATTKYVYGLVRSTNYVNIRNNLRVGMRPIGYCKSRCNGYVLVIFAKIKNAVEVWNVN